VDVTCVVADPQTMDRKALVALLRTKPGVRVVGEAATLDGAARVLRRRAPALLIVDARIRGPGGAGALRILRDRRAGTALLGLVRGCDQQCLAPSAPGSLDADAQPPPCCGRSDCLGRMLLDGADHAMSRSAPPRVLFRALRDLARGRPCAPPDRIRRMMACAARWRDARETRRLTAREEQVADLVGRGYCNQEIADRLRIAVGTVKKHLGHVLVKLNLQDRLQLGLLVARSAALPDAPEARRAASPVRRGPLPPR